MNVEPAKQDEAIPPDEPLIDAARNRRFVLPRPPFFRSRNIMDCGAACLRMIAESHGFRVNYDELCNLIRLSQYGSSLYDLMVAAETVGFRCLTVEASYDDLRQVHLPAVVHLPDEVHFVVVWKLSRNSVLVGDPALGTRRYSRAEFEKLWRGVVLLLEPTEQFRARMAEARYKADDLANLRSLWRFVAPHKKTLLHIALGTILLQVLSAAIPIAVQVVFDSVLASRDRALLGVVFAGVLVVALMSAGVQAARNYLVFLVSTQLERRLIESMYGSVLESTQGLLWRYSVMDLLVRFGEVGFIRDWTVHTFIELAVDVLMLGVYWAILWFYSPEIALVLLALGLGFCGATYVAGRFKLDYTFAYWRAYDWLFQHFKDTFGALSIIKAHSLSRPFKGLMVRHLHATLEMSFRALRWGIVGISSAQLLTVAATGVVLWVGANQIFSHELSTGELAATILLAANVIQPMRRIAESIMGSQQAYVSMHRVGTLLREQQETREDSSGMVELPRQVAHVVFRDVSFRYDGEDPRTGDRWTLRNVSFELRPGEVVGVVGRSGCGKSTIVRLLLRLHDPQLGQITVNGCNVRDATRHSLRSQVALVTQDINIFEGTVYNNITCGRSIDAAKVIAAAQVAGAYEFIEELPYGFHTRIGDRGLQLSGGQKQRIVIARALVGDPGMLVFDEAMAALDPVSESQIHQRLREVVRDRTTLIITHRIQSLQHADRILVIDHGEIVQSGPHSELIERDGLYRELAYAMPSWFKG
jgi:subfamily B ATP-binding cassette protein HlyB/CyaB